MTVYKAFKRFIALWTALAVLVCACVVGGGAYLIYAKGQDSTYAVSRIGSSGNEVKSIQRKLSSLGYYKGKA